ncbi:MAG: hypothetical protein R2710_16055 [Acidimicrobiales bacterium]
MAAATITNALGGYVAELIAAPEWLMVVALIAGLTWLRSPGRRSRWSPPPSSRSSRLVGLGLVLWAGRGSLGDLPSNVDTAARSRRPASRGGRESLAGALSFPIAFLGFEDIDAVAEETNDARVTLPRAIVVTLG